MSLEHPSQQGQFGEQKITPLEELNSFLETIPETVTVQERGREKKFPRQQIIDAITEAVSLVTEKGKPVINVAVNGRLKKLPNDEYRQIVRTILNQLKNEKNEGIKIPEVTSPEGEIVAWFKKNTLEEQLKEIGENVEGLEALLKTYELHKSMIEENPAIDPSLITTCDERMVLITNKIEELASKAKTPEKDTPVPTVQFDESIKTPEELFATLEKSPLNSPEVAKNIQDIFAFIEAHLQDDEKTTSKAIREILEKIPENDGLRKVVRELVHAKIEAHEKEQKKSTPPPLPGTIPPPLPDQEKNKSVSFKNIFSYDDLLQRLEELKDNPAIHVTKLKAKIDADIEKLHQDPTLSIEKIVSEYTDSIKGLRTAIGIIMNKEALTINEQHQASEKKTIEEVKNPPSLDAVSHKILNSLAQLEELTRKLEKDDPHYNEKIQALEEAKRKITKDKQSSSLLSETANRLGLTQENITSVIPEYADLTPAQQILALQNLEQAMVEKIKGEGVARFQENQKGKAWYGKIWDNVRKSYLIAKNEKDALQEAKENVFKVVDQHKFAEIVKNAKELPVEITETGKTQVAFALVGNEGNNNFKHLNREELGQVERFNIFANKFASIPQEYRYETATPAQRKEYADAEALYKTYREKIAQLKAYELNREQKLTNEQTSYELALYLNKVDAQVSIQQFLQTNPDAKKELQKMEEKYLSWQTIKNLANEKSIPALLGFGIRSGISSATIAAGGAMATLNILAAPIAGAVVGGFMANRRVNEQLKNDELKGRKGNQHRLELTTKISLINGKIAEISTSTSLSEEEKEQQIQQLEAERQTTQQELNALPQQKKEIAKNQVPASFLSSKLRLLEDRLESTTNEFEKIKIIQSLKVRIEYTEEKIEEGLVSYGKEHLAIANNVELLQEIGKARALYELYAGNYDEYLKEVYEKVTGKTEIEEVPQSSFFAENGQAKPEGERITDNEVNKVSWIANREEYLRSNLQHLLKERDARVINAQFEYKLWQIGKGTVIGAGCGFAGWVVRHKMLTGDFYPHNFFPYTKTGITSGAIATHSPTPSQIEEHLTGPKVTPTPEPTATPSATPLETPQPTHPTSVAKIIDKTLRGETLSDDESKILDNYNHPEPTATPSPTPETKFTDMGDLSEQHSPETKFTDMGDLTDQSSPTPSPTPEAKFTDMGDLSEQNSPNVPEMDTPSAHATDMGDLTEENPIATTPSATPLETPQPTHPTSVAKIIDKTLRGETLSDDESKILDNYNHPETPSPISGNKQVIQGEIPTQKVEVYEPNTTHNTPTQTVVETKVVNGPKPATEVEILDKHIRGKTIYGNQEQVLKNYFMNKGVNEREAGRLANQFVESHKGEGLKTVHAGDKVQIFENEKGEITDIKVTSKETVFNGPATEMKDVIHDYHTRGQVIHDSAEHSVLQLVKKNPRAFGYDPDSNITPTKWAKMKVDEFFSKPENNYLRTVITHDGNEVAVGHDANGHLVVRVEKGTGLPPKFVDEQPHAVEPTQTTSTGHPVETQPEAPKSTPAPESTPDTPAKTVTPEPEKIIERPATSTPEETSLHEEEPAPELSPAAPKVIEEAEKFHLKLPLNKEGHLDTEKLSLDQQKMFTDLAKEAETTPESDHTFDEEFSSPKENHTAIEDLDRRLDPALKVPESNQGEDLNKLATKGTFNATTYKEIIRLYGKRYPQLKNPKVFDGIERANIEFLQDKQGHIWVRGKTTIHRFIGTGENNAIAGKNTRHMNEYNIAARWPYQHLPKAILKKETLVKVYCPRTGITKYAYPTDWGPNPIAIKSTGSLDLGRNGMSPKFWDRAFDCSPKLIAKLRAKSGDDIEISFVKRGNYDVDPNGNLKLHTPKEIKIGPLTARLRRR